MENLEKFTINIPEFSISFNLYKIISSEIRNQNIVRIKNT